MLADDSSEFTIPKLPPRSTLYCLEPVGIGSPYVESLTGYIARLAEAHCVSVFVLFKELFAPVLEYPASFQLHAGIHAAKAPILNGISAHADDVVRVISGLTMRGDLSLLTLLPWAGAFRPIRLLKRRRVWCPKCYEEWLATDQIIYEPLIWTLKAVEICAKHELRLHSDCPRCGKAQAWLANRSRPGYCSKCQNWLGDLGWYAQANAGTEYTDRGEYLNWVAESMGSVLSAGPRRSTTTRKKSGAEVISECVELIAGGDGKAFAELTGLNSYYVHRWLRGEPPQLPAIIQICYRAGLEVVDYLTGSLDKRKLTKKIKVQAKTKHLPDRPLKYMRANWKGVKEHLERLLRGDEPLPPIREIARRLKVNRLVLSQKFPKLCRAIISRRKMDRFEAEHSYLKANLEKNPPSSLEKLSKGIGFASTAQLRRRHPELCSAITRRYKDYTRGYFAKRKEDRFAEIREVALTLHRDGVYPSFPSVTEKLSMPSIMAQEEMRNTLREVQRELGYRRGQPE